jgi:hypothetical protein
MQKPFVGRAKVEEHNEFIGVTIPRPKDWTLVFFGVISVVLLGFLAIPYWQGTPRVPISRGSEIYKPIDPNSSVLIAVFLSTWILLILFSLVAIFFKVEIIKFYKDKVFVETRVLFFATKRQYDRLHVLRLRILQVAESSGSIFIAPSLAFDYGARTVRFGRGMDEAEAIQILERVGAKFPQYEAVLSTTKSPYLYARQ